MDIENTLYGLACLVAHVLIALATACSLELNRKRLALFAVLRDLIFNSVFIPAELASHPACGAVGNFQVIVAIIAPACAADHHVIQPPGPLVAAVMLDKQF